MIQFSKLEGLNIFGSTKQMLFTAICSFFLFLLSYCPSPSVNLVCNGDFEGHQLYSNWLGQEYSLFASNYSCWYNKNGGMFEIRHKLTPPATYGVDLVTLAPYVLCQNIYLEVSTFYVLEFSMLSQAKMNYLTIIVSINDIWLMNQTVTNVYTFKKGYKIFQASKSKNVLCFDELEYKIIFVQEILSGRDVFANLIYYLCSLLNMGKQKISNFSNNELLKFQLDEKSNGIKIIIEPQRSFTTQNITIVMHESAIIDELQRAKIKYKVYMDGKQISFMLLNQNQKVVIKTIYPISAEIITAISNAYNVLKTCFLSYFIFDVIVFWNLSLLYNFLRISTVPSFSKYFLLKLQKLFFRLNSILQWVSSQNQSIKLALKFDNTKIRQQMDIQKNKFQWFGSFGLSTIFIKNNIQQFVMTSIILIKVLLCLCILKMSFLPQILRDSVPKGRELVLMFIQQAIGLQIFMIISSFQMLLSPCSLLFEQKLNLCCNTVALFCCIVLFALHFLIQEKQKREALMKKVKTKKRNNMNRIFSSITGNPVYISMIPKVSLISQFSSFLKYLSFLFLPSIIVFDSTSAFLLGNTFITFLRLYWLIKYFSVIETTGLEKVFDVINIFVWIVYNTNFIILWIFEGILDLKLGYQLSQQITLCGFVTIFSVIVGGAIQVVKVAIGLILLIKSLFKKVQSFFKKIKENNKDKVCEEVKLENFGKKVAQSLPNSTLNPKISPFQFNSKKNKIVPVDTQKQKNQKPIFIKWSQSTGTGITKLMGRGVRKLKRQFQHNVKKVKIKLTRQTTALNE